MPSMSELYARRYARQGPPKLYPVEFVVRTLLGTYPGLRIDRSTYRGSRILDLGCGDGRNMPLLHDLEFDVRGVEISEEICRLTRARMDQLGVAVEVLPGSNSHVPYPDASFDWVLACHSCYYVSSGETFEDNLREIARVLRPGGRLVFSVAKSDTYILRDAVPLGDGHFQVRHDPYGVRNGVVFRAFSSKDEVAGAFGTYFEDFALGSCENEYYGIDERVFIGTCLRRTQGGR